MSTPIHAVTGAYGYSGKYIARRLLDQGQTVITLTNSSSRPNPFGEAVRAVPFDFDQPDRLAEHLQGVSVLYNTYWVRFNHRRFQHADAVRNTLVLFDGGPARPACGGSSTSASPTRRQIRPWNISAARPRWRRRCIDSGVSYAILRPAVLFGKEDILVNNIAWTLRRLPVFGVFGDGQLSPAADLRRRPGGVGRPAGRKCGKCDHQRHRAGDILHTASWWRRSGGCIGWPRRVVSVPPWFGYAASWLLGRLVGDVIVTRDEIRGLMAGSAVRRCPGKRKDRLERVGGRPCGQLGPKVLQRVGPAERPHVGLFCKLITEKRLAFAARPTDNCGLGTFRFCSGNLNS